MEKSVQLKKKHQQPVVEEPPVEIELENNNNEFTPDVDHTMKQQDRQSIVEDEPLPVVNEEKEEEVSVKVRDAEDL